MYSLLFTTLRFLCFISMAIVANTIFVILYPSEYLQIHSIDVITTSWYKASQGTIRLYFIFVAKFPFKQYTIFSWRTFKRYFANRPGFLIFKLDYWVFLKKNKIV